MIMHYEMLYTAYDSENTVKIIIMNNAVIDFG